MLFLEIIFWLSLLLVVWTYAGYPALAAGMARLRGRTIVRDDTVRPATIILSALNEADRIGNRLDELGGLIKENGGEIIVVSDGSTDETAAIARAAGEWVRVIEFEDNRGKAAALTEAARHAKHEYLVFADVRQRWSDDALSKLLRNFADPQVGAVSGELILEDNDGAIAGVGLYWRYEKWIRNQESRWHSTVGVTGAIAAVRRKLFQPIPRGVVLDDVYWPLRVAMSGHRVILEKDAKAFDQLPEKSGHEFNRKVRTLSGNYQLAMQLPSSMSPVHNPVWFQFVSHKLCRLIVPWALLAMMFCCCLLPHVGYRMFLGVQALCYLIAAGGLIVPRFGRMRLASAASSFLVLNAAAWTAFWVWAMGRVEKSWTKSSYQSTEKPSTPVQDKEPAVVSGSR